VFEALLFGSMSESHGDVVVRVVRAIDLHKCADFYLITGLQQATAEYVAASLEDKTAV